MTQDEIIELAKQANLTKWDDPYFGTYTANVTSLWRFAKLVEDKVTARYMQLFLDPENQPTQFGTATQEYREQEIKAEREACAKVADQISDKYGWGYYGNEVDTADEIADAIRARGEL